MSHKVSLSTIASLAGVSTATVSRVFSGRSYVDPETRQKILRIAQEQGFTPRSYKKRETTGTHDRFVGIVVADLTNVFFQEIIATITAILSQNGIRVLLYDSAESVQKELQALNLLQQLQMDGIFISPVSESAQNNAEYLKALHREGLPIILIDRDVKGIGFDGVFQDNYTAAVSVVNMLAENKHKHIAHISGPITAKPGLDRLNGYIDALNRLGLPVRQEYICYGDFHMKSGYNLTASLITKYPEITAIYCSNNLMTVGCIRAIYEAGLRIPEDISVISTGSLNQFDLFGNSNITEVLLPTSFMGEECANMMLARLEQRRSKQKPGPVKRISFDCTISLKGSETFPVNKLPQAKSDI